MANEPSKVTAVTAVVTKSSQNYSMNFSEEGFFITKRNALGVDKVWSLPADDEFVKTLLAGLSNYIERVW